MKFDKFIIKQWTVAVLPLMIIVLCAVTIFKEQVVSSVASTPHPELVYTIWVTFGLGVVVVLMSLIHFTKEQVWLTQGLDNLCASKSSWVSDALPIYQVLEGNYSILASKRHAVLELELVALKTRFENRLSFANFIAGALVGLGLLGTFIGLLGAMGDLGKLFEVLGQSQGNLNPVDLFTDMVKRLQEPMKGMGTAFVSSLYGLMGSIVIGFLILVVSRMAEKTYEQIHELVRNNEYGSNDIRFESLQEQTNEDNSAYEDISSLAMQLQDNTKHWQLAFAQMQQAHEKSLYETRVLRGEVLSVVSSMQELSSSLRANIKNKNNQEDLQLKALEDISGVLVSLEKRVDGHINAFLKDA